MPQVTPHRGVGWPSSVKKSPLVSITSNMFFSDSGKASASRSVLAVAQKCPMISRMESQRAGNVGRLERGVRCWRKTLDNIMAALSLVSSLPWSPFPTSSSFLNIGNKTLKNANSHCEGDKTWRSGSRRLLCRRVRDWVLTCWRESQQSLAMPCRAGHQATSHSSPGCLAQAVCTPSALVSSTCIKSSSWRVT